MSVTHFVYYNCSHLRLVVTHEHDGDECPANMPDSTTTPENCFPCMNPKSGSDSDGNSLDRYFVSEFSSISGSSGDATDSDYDGDDEDDEGDNGSDDEVLSDEMLSDNGSSVPARRLTNVNPAEECKTSGS